MILLGYQARRWPKLQHILMWGTDMTATVTVAEGAACVFVAVDHCTTECIGLHAAKRGNRFEALEPIRQGVRERFGGIGDGVARG